MYKYGLRIYFTEDGIIVFQTGYIMVNFPNYWVNNDPMKWHPDLKGREDVSMIQYPWGKYFDEYGSMQLVGMNPDTMEPIFEPWPEPEAPANAEK